MSDSDFTAHETDEFTEEDGCQNGVDYITQPLEPNDFVLLKLSKKESRAMFCSADPISEETTSCRYTARRYAQWLPVVQNRGHSPWKRKEH